MNSIWRSDGMPAADMWFSGGSINYYYFGHYASTWLARLANIKPLIAYQLAMASLPALSLVLAASFGLHMLQFRINKSAIDHRGVNLSTDSYLIGIGGFLKWSDTHIRRQSACISLLGQEPGS
jgi:uncharacterized membrane protein